MKWTRRRLVRFALKWAIENLGMIVELITLAWALLDWMTG